MKIYTGYFLSCYSIKIKQLKIEIFSIKYAHLILPFSEHKEEAILVTIINITYPEIMRLIMSKQFTIILPPEKILLKISKKVPLVLTSKP